MMGADFIWPAWICEALLRELRARYSNTLPAEAPHGVTIGGPQSPYLRRWFVTPRGDGPAVYLHQFLRDDDDRALHDHPWPSVGIILAGGYMEHTSAGPMVRSVGDVVVRQPLDRHRVVLFREPDGTARQAWTLFSVGPRAREWGWCPGAGAGERFVPWQEFGAGEHGELPEKGCAE